MSTEIEEEYTIDDLDHFWMADGLPMFIADRADICDIVESIGFSIYYLLGNEDKIVNPPTSSNKDNKNVSTPQSYAPVIKSTAKIYKVVNNFVGRTVSLSDSVGFGENIVPIEENAVYSLPYIPHILVDKLDQFFRLVDAQHGTESIVMLTYDIEKEGSEGWGILVPDQTNTSVHCNYDPHSIAEIKPDNVIIVGSVHSHPGMSAYASGTDHKDQADFDGIHITFGWQKSVNNGATQYHIEMQMAGKAYTLKPEDVFEDYVIDKEPDPEVVGWTDKVKKVSPPNMGGATEHTRTAHQQELLAGQVVQGYTPHGTQDSGVTPRTTSGNIRTLPHFDIEEDAIIIAEVDFNNGATTFCPACGAVLDHIDSRNSCCEFCDIPLAQKNDSLASIIDAIAYYCYQLKIAYTVPVYLWCTDETGCHFVIRLTNTTLADTLNDGQDSSFDRPPLSLVEELDDDDIFNSNKPFSYNNVRISSDDILRFEQATQDIYVYDNTALCYECEFYYSTDCPAYKDVIYEYITDSTTDIQSYERSISELGCHMYTPYGTTVGGIYNDYNER